MHLLFRDEGNCIFGNLEGKCGYDSSLQRFGSSLGNIIDEYSMEHIMYFDPCIVMAI